MSRVIWKAGQYRINEAAPLIVKLFSHGDQLHEYCCTWALSRCAAGNPEAVEILKFIFTSPHPVAAISKTAGTGLIKWLTGTAKEIHLGSYLTQLPDDIKKTIENTDTGSFDAVLQEKIVHAQPGYKWLEDLYILSFDNQFIKAGLHKILQQIPLRPNFFKHILAIFKAAGMLDDFETAGLLTCRFEREPEMFNHTISKAQADIEEVYIKESNEPVRLSKEFRKTNSRLAYSQKTRWYFHRRMVTQLNLLGHHDDTNYVKLAVALLIRYKAASDFRKQYSTFEYV